jgi:protein-L-isoaspartate(D-aspartate) O-methyltransferase
MIFKRIRAQRLDLVRAAYAKQILANAGVWDDDRLLRAFGAVPREAFLPRGPWHFSRSDGYMPLKENDPELVYQDVVLGIDLDNQINNGLPSLHAWAIHQLQPAVGERVAHIGAGAGYYSAILSHLVGQRGKVLAVEFNPNVAAQARRNLQAYSNIEVVEGNGLDQPSQLVDVVYVNFATDRPALTWLQNLAPGGRVIFVLGVPVIGPDGEDGAITESAAYLLVVRTGSNFEARYLAPVFFLWGAGLPAADRSALREAFASGGIERIRRLRLGEQLGSQEWYSARDWGLCCDPLAAG